MERAISVPRGYVKRVLKGIGMIGLNRFKALKKGIRQPLSIVSHETEQTSEQP